MRETEEDWKDGFYTIQKRLRVVLAREQFRLEEDKKYNYLHMSRAARNELWRQNVDLIEKVEELKHDIEVRDKIIEEYQRFFRKKK